MIARLAVRLAALLALLWLALPLAATAASRGPIALPGAADRLLVMGPDRLAAASRDSGDLYVVDISSRTVEAYPAALEGLRALAAAPGEEGAFYAILDHRPTPRIVALQLGPEGPSRSEIRIPRGIAQPAMLAIRGGLLVWDRDESAGAVIYRVTREGRAAPLKTEFPPRALAGLGVEGLVMALDPAGGRASIVDVTGGDVLDLIDFAPFPPSVDPAVFTPLGPGGGSGDVLLADAPTGALLLLTLESAKLARLATPLQISFYFPGALGGGGRTLLAADAALSLILVGRTEERQVLALARRAGGIEILGARRMAAPIADLAVLHDATPRGGDLLASLDASGREIVLRPVDDLKDPARFRTLAPALARLQPAPPVALTAEPAAPVVVAPVPQEAPAVAEPAPQAWAGSREEVANLQVALASRGFDAGPVDGLMGPATSRAVAAFQRAEGLPETGIPDPATLAALDEVDEVDEVEEVEEVEEMMYPEPAAVAEAILPDGITMSETYEVKRTLGTLGYEVGTIGGTLDSFTRSAIRAFQFEQDLPVTGEIDPNTRSALDQAVDEIREGGKFQAEPAGDSFDSYLRKSLGEEGARTLAGTERGGAFDPARLLTLGASHGDPSHPCFGLNAPPPRRLWPNAVRLARIVQGIETTLGTRVEIDSAYRTPAYNRCVGAPPRSPHLDFAAVDLAPLGTLDVAAINTAFATLVRRTGITARAARPGGILHVALTDPPVRRTRVFLQFAGMTPSDARELSRRLSARGFDLPDAEAVRAAAGMWEIRYYHAGDRATAREAGAAVSEATRALGIADRPSPRAVDLSGFRGQKPDPGVIELWIGL